MIFIQVNICVDRPVLFCEVFFLESVALFENNPQQEEWLQNKQTWQEQTKYGRKWTASFSPGQALDIDKRCQCQLWVCFNQVPNGSVGHADFKNVVERLFQNSWQEAWKSV